MNEESHCYGVRMKCAICTATADYWHDKPGDMPILRDAAVSLGWRYVGYKIAPRVLTGARSFFCPTHTAELEAYQKRASEWNERRYSSGKAHYAAYQAAWEAFEAAHPRPMPPWMEPK